MHPYCTNVGIFTHVDLIQFEFARVDVEFLITDIPHQAFTSSKDPSCLKLFCVWRLPNGVERVFGWYHECVWRVS